ncbi:hypothetical protein BH10PSE16_BH10PSE16_01580 [soil metagenome]
MTTVGLDDAAPDFCTAAHPMNRKAGDAMLVVAGVQDRPSWRNAFFQSSVL